MAPFLRLKFERIRRHLSQDQLGRKTGIRQSDISAMERGRLNPTEDELARLANALLINPPSVLLKEIPIRDPEPENHEEEKVGV